MPEEATGPSPGGWVDRGDRLEGRIALVTGAASGIGLATARLLAARGAVVHAADVKERGNGSRERRGDPREPGADPPGDSERAPGDGTDLRLDVRSEPDWERAVASILEEHGRLDILVHAAGISAASPLADTTLAAWREVLGTNLDGSFLAVRHGIRAMAEAGGAIVLLGSASGIRPSSGAAAYSTSKAGVAMLARAAAKECRDAGLPVRINVLSPAGVKTPMWETMPFFQDLVREHGSAEAAFAAMEAEGGGRFADPEEIARSILFLVSDASAHVTGVELAVDDGYTL